MERFVYPFSAIVGQDKMKLALVLNAIHPAIGGVLIRGEKGTGKSTAVRALARLLPELSVVADCLYRCDPDATESLCSDCQDRLARGETLPRARRRMRVVELPINASEDRVVGAIDIEAAIKSGERRFEPGVLAEANRNILYVDEVNLLDDHLVDVLLDAAAMGVNVIEREGVSYSHPAGFILVGTMNPEEGELRPQLLDRFGLCVDVEGIRDHDEPTPADHGEEQEGSQPTESATGDPQASESEATSEATTEQTASSSETGQQSAGADTGVTTGGSSGHESSPDALETFNLRRIDLPRQRRVRKQGGKRAASQTPDRRGRYVRAEPKEKVSDLAIDATVRAAAPLQRERGLRHGERLMLERQDLRQKVRERKVGNLIVFVVDASASMDAEQRMAATKGAILSLLQDAYVRRDRVAVVIFKNRTAEVVMRPTSSVSLARRRLERLSVGGTTPLTHGLMAGYKVVKTELLRDPTIRPLLVLISDGRGNISMFKEEPLVEAQKVAALIEAENIDALVIDSARDYSHLPSVQHLARVAPMYHTYAINAGAAFEEQVGDHYYHLC